MKPRHLNNGDCEKCDAIFDRYPGFHSGLRNWFKALQARNPDAHVSEAGRGRALQEEYLKRGSSRAGYGKSAHNWNAAIDIFRLTVNGAQYDRPWFYDTIGADVSRHNRQPIYGFLLTWYGAPGSKFFELPHVEVKDWRELAKEGKIALVEPTSPASESDDT